jgi:hypothetical protein
LSKSFSAPGGSGAKPLALTGIAAANRLFICKLEIIFSKQLFPYRVHRGRTLIFRFVEFSSSDSNSYSPPELSEVNPVRLVGYEKTSVAEISSSHTRRN